MDGQDVTMYIKGLEVDGKEYLLPSYDPASGSILTDEGTVDKFKGLIDSGKIKGYDSPEQAEAERKKMYPVIVGQRQKHSHGGKVLKACKS
jgi:hypothetical protein